MAKNTSSVDPRCKKTHILGKHTCQIYPQTIPRKDSQRAIEVSIFGKTQGSTFFFANAANSYGFNYVLSVVSSNKYWSKKHHPWDPGFKQRVYYEEAGKYKYHLKTDMFEKQAYKQVSVEARDESRNTTDVPTNVMLPAHMKKVVLPEKRF